MEFRERREYSRAKVEWPVNISADQGLIQGTIKNISLGGALIRLEQLPNMDETLELSIEIPEHSYAVFANAEAIRFDVYASDETPVSYGLGVRITDLPEDDFEFLSSTALR